MATKPQTVAPLIAATSRYHAGSAPDWQARFANECLTMTTIPFVASAGDADSAAWVAALQRAMPEERIRAFADCSDEEKRESTVAIVANPDPAEIAALPRLAWVHSVWAGVERLVAELPRRDPSLSIVRLVDPELAATMAEAVLAWTLFLHRDMPAYARQQRERLWQARRHIAARDRRVGVLGLGELGAAGARRLVAAGFTVHGWSRALKSIDGVTCHAGAGELKPMLAASDIIVCLLPLTAATHGLLNGETLACLPHGASLINFSRGQIVDDDALRAALDAGAIEHAVLDVFAVEPLPPESWHWSHSRVSVLPHCSGPTTRRSAAAIVAANLKRYRQTGEIPASVDRERGY